MAEPFLTEIRIMSFGYAPRGWALCNGQLLPINQNQALFSLLGTSRARRMLKITSVHKRSVRANAGYSCPPSCIGHTSGIRGDRARG